MKNLSRWGLGPEVTAMLLDWCAANYKAQATEIVSEAIKAHIEGRLEREPEMHKRFEAARMRRIGGAKPKIVALKEGE